MAKRAVTIPGPAGAIEASIGDGADPEGAIALLCHPHPQYGGTMHDAVLDTAEKALAPAIRASLRFNFRGVGGSDGAFDGGDGEVDDVAAAADYLSSEFPGARLWLVGYSFGAAMVWRARTRLDAERIVLIAPPMGAMKFDSDSARTTRIDAVYGDADEFIDADATKAWSASQPNAHLHIIPGCDHFFAGQHAALARVLASL